MIYDDFKESELKLIHAKTELFGTHFKLSKTYIHGVTTPFAPSHTITNTTSHMINIMPKHSI